MSIFPKENNKIKEKLVVHRARGGASTSNGKRKSQPTRWRRGQEKSSDGEGHEKAKKGTRTRKPVQKAVKARPAVVVVAKPRRKATNAAEKEIEKSPTFQDQLQALRRLIARKLKRIRFQEVK